MSPPSLFSAGRRGVLVRVRVTPRAACDRVDGIETGVAGEPVLKVSVAAPPEKGRANAALLRLLAREWRLPKSLLSVTAGASGRRKTVGIAGDSAPLRAKLEAWARDRRSVDGR